jgi:hypothetical protein
MEQLSPETLQGEDFGNLGKYNAVPGLLAGYRKDPLGGAVTGRGYLSRKEMLKKLREVSSWGGTDPEVLSALQQKIEASKYPYFTSTRVD